MQYNTGFTLIELLVVISIISLLSSVVLSSISGARSSARDASRRQDFRQIKQALEMYYNDHGHYPKCPVSSHYIDDGGVCPPSHAGPALENGDYLSNFPTDPLHGGDGNDDWGYDYQYRTFDDGQVYILRTAFETKLDRTHDYPSNRWCQTDGSDPINYPQCGFTEPRCVYVTATIYDPTCDWYWLQVGSGS